MMTTPARHSSFALPRSALLAVALACLTGFAPGTRPTVTAPPPALYEKMNDDDRRVATAFYAKYLDIDGVPVTAHRDVDDAALLRTREIVTRLLANRPDVLKAMAKAGTRLLIIGKAQQYCDLPEYRHEPDPKKMNARVRGTGGLDLCSFGEENLLHLPGDRYPNESIAVHEFCHTIDAALATIDPKWPEKLDATYRAALAKGLWKGTYAATDTAEYWAELCQSYFDCNGKNDRSHNDVATRARLETYDPEGYELVRTTFALTPDNDWRYAPPDRTKP